MKNYAHLIERKLLEAICEKLEIDHAAIVEPIRAEWKKASVERKAERDEEIAKILGPTVELCAEEDRPRLEAKLRNLTAEKDAAWHDYDSEKDPVESAKLKAAWSHLLRECDQIKERLGLVATR